MKIKLCSVVGCGLEVHNFKNSSIKGRFCKDHAITHAIEKTCLNRLKQAKKERSEKVKEVKQKKEQLQPKSYFEKQLEKEINSMVRLIDKDKGCISCEHGWTTTPTRQFHAGHFASVGSNPSLRFNLFNIFKQCSICNNWLSSNALNYEKGLIKIYGHENFEYIKSLPLLYPSLNLSKEDIKEAIKIARELKREIEKGKEYTRQEINSILNIYFLK